MIKIKQATKKGYIECVGGGIADLSYPNSLTRRGRVQEHGLICPTITTQGELYKIMSEVDVYRLTPRETWRLMGFSDEDFEKAEKAQNGAQGHLYRQAGNSICVKVLETVFKEMLGEQKTEMNERIIESEIRLQRDKEIAEIIEDLFKPGAESDYDKGFNEALMLIHDKVMC